MWKLSRLPALFRLRFFLLVESVRLGNGSPEGGFIGLEFGLVKRVRAVFEVDYNSPDLCGGLLSSAEGTGLATLPLWP